MEDIAVQLFKLGDREHKGFIVKRDMQRLQGEVELPPDQLEAVFDSLDSSQNGYLTLDQFLAGVTHLGTDRPAERRTESEPDLSVQQLLSLNVLHKSGELMCEVRQMVSSEDTWHQLLAALFSDLNQLLRQISHLEDTLRLRDHQHQEEMRRLYEEMEVQLVEERGRLQDQLRQRESVLRAELSSKEQLICELMEQRDGLQERLRTQSERRISGPRTGALLNTPQKEDEGGGGGNLLSEEQSRRRAERVAQQSYQQGFSHAQQLATLQEEGLVKQLRLLQEMQENLRSTPKQKRHSFSYDDL